MKIAVVGAGYVGLVSAVCFAEFGYQVHSIDLDEEKIAKLKRGELTLFEAGLQRLLNHNLEAKRIHFSSDMASSIQDAKVIFLAVGTPLKKKSNGAELSYLYQAIDQICEVIQEDKILVIKSTVPIGTAQKIRDYLKSKDLPFHCSIVSNPEFLREGSAVEDFMKPARVVLGSDNEAALATIDELYAPLKVKNIPIIHTSSETAELTKYAANSFLATKITFMNEMADLCEKVGGDIHTVAFAMGLDHRIANEFLNPGPGYGGSCFPKDCQALIDVGERQNIPLRIVNAVHHANVSRKQTLMHRIKTHHADVKDQTIALLGVTFKANTDDIRESPAIEVVEALLKEGAKVKLHDPQGLENAAKLFGNQIQYCDSVQECVTSSKIIVIITEWDEYKALDFEEIKSLSNSEFIFDFRNLYDPKHVESHGLKYISIGR